VEERIAQVRAYVVGGGGGADYHDQPGEHWITGRIATLGSGPIRKKGDKILEEFFSSCGRELGAVEPAHF